MRLLDLLGSYDAKAAFLLIGGWAAREPGQSARGARFVTVAELAVSSRGY